MVDKRMRQHYYLTHTNNHDRYNNDDKLYKFNKFVASQNDLLQRYNKCIELALEFLYRDNNTHAAIQHYKDSIEIMNLYNTNHKFEKNEDCTYAIDTLGELYIKVADCYIKNDKHTDAYKYLKSLHESDEPNQNNANTRIIIEKKLKIRNFIQNKYDNDIILCYNNKIMDKNEHIICGEAYVDIIIVEGNIEHCTKLISKINWFSQKGLYIDDAKKLLNEMGTDNTDNIQINENIDYKLITDQLQSSVHIFETAFLYLTKDELLILERLENKIKNHSKGLKLQLDKIKRKHEIANNITAQTNICQWFDDLRTSLKKADLQKAYLILTRIINAAKTITNSEDVENAGLVYTEPLIFTSYHVYLTRELQRYDINRDYDVNEQLRKIKNKLEFLIFEKYNKK